MRSRDWTAQAHVANRMLELKVDRGAQTNLSPYCMHQKLLPRMQLKDSNSVLLSYVEGIIKHLDVVTESRNVQQVD